MKSSSLAKLVVLLFCLVVMIWSVLSFVYAPGRREGPPVLAREDGQLIGSVFEGQARIPGGRTRGFRDTKVAAGRCAPVSRFKRAVASLTTLPVVHAQS